MSVKPLSARTVSWPLAQGSAPAPPSCRKCCEQLGSGSGPMEIVCPAHIPWSRESVVSGQPGHHQGCVAGSGPSRPGPGQQLAAHPVQLADGPQRKLRRKVPSVDGALTKNTGLPPARSASASSMQSPPASAEATSVIILSPVLARPGASPRSRRCCTSWERPRCRAKVAGRSRPAPPGGDHRRPF